MREILLTVLLAMLAPQIVLVDETYDKCLIGTNGTNYSWEACGSEWIDRSENALNEAWNMLYGSVGDQTKDDLLAEQNAWSSYKENSCLFWGNGAWSQVSQVLHFAICRAGVIESRINELKVYKDQTSAEP
jgi:uncharacterized protein YecT (DUF1311 family)